MNAHNIVGSLHLCMHIENVRKRDIQYLVKLCIYIGGFALLIQWYRDYIKGMETDWDRCML